MSKSFLHPSQRSLKTDQIGPSGHKNLYHVGVLEGNWFEERRGFGPQPTAEEDASFVATSTQRVSYTDCGAKLRKDAKPMEACSFEAPRELLFCHGQGHVSSQYSVTELSYRDARSPALSYKEILAVEGVSPRRSRSNAKKAEASCEDAQDGAATITSPEEGVPIDAEAAGAELAATTSSSSNSSRYHLPPIGAALTRDRFTTSKHVSIDATGAFLKQNLKDIYCPSGNVRSRGEFLTSLNNAMHKTNLRY